MPIFSNYELFVSMLYSANIQMLIKGSRDNSANIQMLIKASRYNSAWSLIFISAHATWASMNKSMRVLLVSGWSISARNLHYSSGDHVMFYWYCSFWDLRFHECGLRVVAAVLHRAIPNYWLSKQILDLRQESGKKYSRIFIFFSM